MRALVTGAAGFIGSHLCDVLVEAGAVVVGVDNLSLGKTENLRHLMDKPGFSLVIKDVLDRDSMNALFSRHSFDTVYHLAANSDIARSVAEPSVDLDNTFLTTFSVLSLMQKHGVPQLVFASSSAVYGESSAPIAEDHGPLVPASHYGAAKLASEAFISSFAQCYGLRAWIARFPNVVGSRATHGVIFDFISRLRVAPDRLDVLGDGAQCKPYLHVRDLVKAIMFIKDRSNDQINIFNIGTNGGTTVRTIANEVVAAMGGRAKIHYGTSARGWVGDVPFFSYELKKIFALGWRPARSSDEAIKLAISEMI